MKLALSLLFWLALFPGSDGVCGDPAPFAVCLPSTPALTSRALDLCISAGHTPAVRSSSIRHESACEQEESSDSEDLSGSSSLTTEIRDPSPVSFRATLRLRDVAPTSLRSAILRC